MNKTINKYLTNPHNFPLTYLRLSLTKNCNMSCIHCKPANSPYWYHQSSKLKLYEIQNILQAFKNLNFTKVRFTGGEPTLHPDYLKAINIAKQLEYTKICITTNAILINDVNALKNNGLNQINISLHSINPKTFAKITNTDKLNHVLKIIEQALKIGIKIKVNTVLLRNINFNEIHDMINWAAAIPITLRFIEIMPTVLNSEFYLKEQILQKDLIPILKEYGFKQVTTYDTTNINNTFGPEVIWQHEKYPGKIGLISPISQKFCKFCNRLRITADGKLKLCLLEKDSYSLDLSSPQTITNTVYNIIMNKPKNYNVKFLNDKEHQIYCFRQIGG